jgi:uncharacterized protein
MGSECPFANNGEEIHDQSKATQLRIVIIGWVRHYNRTFAGDDKRICSAVGSRPEGQSSQDAGSTHMMVGTSDGTTRAGHVLAAYVSPTLEVMVAVDPVAMQKRFDPETDLTLIDPALK